MTEKFRPWPILEPGQLSTEQIEIAGLDIKQAVDGTFYDTRYFFADKLVRKGEIKFFDVPKTGWEEIANFSQMGINKYTVQTNLNNARRMDRGALFQCDSIGVAVLIPSPFIKEDFGFVPVEPNRVEHLRRVLGKSIKLSSHIGQQQLETGLVEEWPVEFEGAGLTFEDHLENNSIVMRKLKFPRMILPSQEFHVRLEFLNEFTPDYNFEIKVIFKGNYFRDVS